MGKSNKKTDRKMNLRSNKSFKEKAERQSKTMRSPIKLRSRNQGQIKAEKSFEINEPHKGERDVTDGEFFEEKQ